MKVSQASGLKAEEVVETADRLIKGEAASSAIPVLNSFLQDTDNPAVWMRLARAYMVLGEELICRAILRNVVRKMPNPHIVYIIAARIPACKPLVLESQKLLYFNVPKCGSSTFKDAILIREGDAPKQERSHFFASRFERVLGFSDIDQQFKDYRSILITRHPRDRLRSYWKKNITESNSLVNEAGGRKTFYGLSTKPSYDEIIARFAKYRSIFIDFRHHTDSIVGYTGQNPKRITNIFALDQLPQAMKLLNLPPDPSLGKIENMKSKSQFAESGVNLGREDEVVSAFYKRELELYFPAHANP